MCTRCEGWTVNRDGELSAVPLLFEGRIRKTPSKNWTSSALKDIWDREKASRSVARRRAECNCEVSKNHSSKKKASTIKRGVERLSQEIQSPRREKNDH